MNESYNSYKESKHDRNSLRLQFIVKYLCLLNWTIKIVLKTAIYQTSVIRKVVVDSRSV